MCLSGGKMKLRGAWKSILNQAIRTFTDCKIGKETYNYCTVNVGRFSNNTTFAHCKYIKCRKFKFFTSSSLLEELGSVDIFVNGAVQHEKQKINTGNKYAIQLLFAFLQ